jgi:cytochrome c biogenesis protein CcmG, thiol:disulfide interchange protein DsbE
MRFALPLGIFVLLVILLGFGLTQDPKRVPSPLIDKAAPAFQLPVLSNQAEHFSPADMKGKVWLLNVWASWCVSCRAEHEIIKKLSRMKLVDIVGLNYKDEAVDGQRWLQQFGNPYTLSVADFDGRVGIDWGVYGVPETFLIGKDGVIKYKHIGPVTDQSLHDELIPRIKALL